MQRRSTERPIHDHWLNTLRASAVAGALACCLPCWPPLHAQLNQTSQPSLPTLDAFTRNMQRIEGFIPFFHNPENGRLFLEIPRLEDRFLYFASLATGITWPAERGNMSEQAALVHFERSGPRVLLIENNPRLVVTGADSARVMPAVAASFGSGILATFMAAAEQEGRLLIDATDFLLRDALHVSADFAASGEGTIMFDGPRSRVLFDASKGAANATQLSVLLAFQVQRAGPALQQGAPAGGNVSARLVHSLVALPDRGYASRAADPRLGFMPLLVHDFGGTFQTGYQRRVIQRWRLDKKDPNARLSEPVRPITFYLESGIPELYRTAFREGILYWNRVFEAAGFRNAIRVADLPPDANFWDLRYPIVVLWSPSTRTKASLATRITDPRTGEVLKANLLMDAHRSIVDYNTYMAMRPALAPGQLDTQTFVLARRKWQSAHEAGHILAGMQHNSIVPSQLGFSTPAVRVRNDRITLDVSAALLSEPTAYDEWMIRYAYTPFTSGEESAGLEAIAADGIGRALRFVNDFPARSIPRATSRLETADPLESLDIAVAARRAMLAHFSEQALAPNEPMALLADRLVPVYFHHRYALAAVVKAVGGVDYIYAKNGDGQPAARPLDPGTQRRALSALATALSPRELAIPARVSLLIPPRADAQSPPELTVTEAETDMFVTGESAPITIARAAGGIFDPLAWARALVTTIVDDLLERHRLERIVSLHAIDSAQPSLEELLITLVDSTWQVPPSSDSQLAALQRIAERGVLDRLAAVARDTAATIEVRAAVNATLLELRDRLTRRETSDPVERAHLALALRDIDRAR